MNSIREFGLNIYLFVSKGLESCFEAFFPFPRGWKVFFFSFSFIQGVGKPFFSVFCSSKGLEDHFFPIFCSSKGLEDQFFPFFAHPRGWKTCFSSFSFIQGVGRPVFSVFCSAEASDGHFFSIAPSKPKQILKPNSHNSIGNTYGQGCCVHFCFSALLRIYKRLLEVSS